MCCVIFYVKWHDLSREEQQKYYEKARSARQLHMEMYPHWNARDNYRFGLKKKKRKRDKSDDPGTKLSYFPFLISYSGMPWAKVNNPSIMIWLNRRDKYICNCIQAKFIYPKYSKHWPYLLAYTIDCDCSKMLNHGLNHVQGVFPLLNWFRIII